MKICKLCRIEKNLMEFYKHKRSKDGYRSDCKICEIKRSKKWQNDNPERRKKNNEKWRINNEEYHKNYYINLSNDLKRKRNENRKDDKEKAKIYKQINRNKMNEHRRKKRKDDPLLRLSQNIRSCISNLFKIRNLTKNLKTFEILGCTFNEFKLYLESKFESWMTWDNYGKYNGNINYGWDIDHITPISLAKTMDEIVDLNHHTNLQPLCSYTNRHIKRDILVQLN